MLDRLTFVGVALRLALGALALAPFAVLGTPRSRRTGSRDSRRGGPVSEDATAIGCYHDNR